MELNEMLKEWNNGIMRGAKSKLARVLKLSHVTVLQWFNFQTRPSEIQIKKMSKIFKKTEEELKEIFHIADRINFSQNKSAGHIGVNIAGNINDLAHYKESLKSELNKIQNELEKLNLKMDLILEKLKK